jgi:hypothetical protein
MGGRSMTNQVPAPRERGLQPTHFIDVWKNCDDGFIYYGCNEALKCTALDPDIDPINYLDYFPDEQTIAIFKIYPKNIS